MLAIMSKNLILPSSFLRDFRALAEKGKVLSGAEPGHKDGWGIVGYQKGAPIYLGREPKNAMDRDSRYDEALKYLDQLCIKGPLLAHFRKASLEYRRVTLQNTAPFVQGKWSFAHNGTIRRFNEEVSGMKGTTDSERFFVKLLTERERSGGSMEKAIERTVRRVRDSYDYSSITFLLSDGANIYAYREYSNPEQSDYYNLIYASDKDRVIISQQAIWPKEWVTVPNRTLVIVMSDLKVCSKGI
jgi:predicted glutamine amidotransferase